MWRTITHATGSLLDEKVLGVNFAKVFFISSRLRELRTMLSLSRAGITRLSALYRGGERPQSAEDIRATLAWFGATTWESSITPRTFDTTREQTVTEGLDLRRVIGAGLVEQNVYPSFLTRPEGENEEACAELARVLYSSTNQWSAKPRFPAAGLAPMSQAEFVLLANLVTVSESNSASPGELPKSAIKRAVRAFVSGLPWTALVLWPPPVAGIRSRAELDGVLRGKAGSQAFPEVITGGANGDLAPRPLAEQIAHALASAHPFANVAVHVEGLAGIGKSALAALISRHWFAAGGRVVVYLTNAAGLDGEEPDPGDLKETERDARVLHIVDLSDDESRRAFVDAHNAILRCRRVLVVGTPSQPAILYGPPARPRERARSALEEAAPIQGDVPQFFAPGRWRIPMPIWTPDEFPAIIEAMARSSGVRIRPIEMADLVNRYAPPDPVADEPEHVRTGLGVVKRVGLLPLLRTWLRLAHAGAEPMDGFQEVSIAAFRLATDEGLAEAYENYAVKIGQEAQLQFLRGCGVLSRAGIGAEPSHWPEPVLKVIWSWTQTPGHGETSWNEACGRFQAAGLLRRVGRIEFPNEEGVALWQVVMRLEHLRSLARDEGKEKLATLLAGESAKAIGGDHVVLNLASGTVQIANATDAGPDHLARAIQCLADAPNLTQTLVWGSRSMEWNAYRAAVEIAAGRAFAAGKVRAEGHGGGDRAALLAAGGWSEIKAMDAARGDELFVAAVRLAWLARLARLPFRFRTDALGCALDLMGPAKWPRVAEMPDQPAPPTELSDLLDLTLALIGRVEGARVHDTRPMWDREKRRLIVEGWLTRRGRPLRQVGFGTEPWRRFEWKRRHRLLLALKFEDEDELVNEFTQAQDDSAWLDWLPLARYEDEQESTLAVLEWIDSVRGQKIRETLATSEGWRAPLPTVRQFRWLRTQARRGAIAIGDEFEAGLRSLRRLDANFLAEALDQSQNPRRDAFYLLSSANFLSPKEEAPRLGHVIADALPDRALFAAPASELRLLLLNLYQAEQSSARRVAERIVSREFGSVITNGISLGQLVHTLERTLPGSASGWFSQTSTPREFLSAMRASEIDSFLVALGHHAPDAGRFLFLNEQGAEVLADATGANTWTRRGALRIAGLPLPKTPPLQVSATAELVPARLLEILAAVHAVKADAPRLLAPMLAATEALDNASGWLPLLLADLAPLNPDADLHVLFDKIITGSVDQRTSVVDQLLAEGIVEGGVVKRAKPPQWLEGEAEPHHRAFPSAVRDGLVENLTPTGAPEWVGRLRGDLPVIQALRTKVDAILAPIDSGALRLTEWDKTTKELSARTELDHVAPWRAKLLTVGRVRWKAHITDGGFDILFVRGSMRAVSLDRVASMETID